MGLTSFAGSVRLFPANAMLQAARLPANISAGFTACIGQEKGCDRIGRARVALRAAENRLGGRFRIFPFPMPCVVVALVGLSGTQYNQSIIRMMMGFSGGWLTAIDNVVAHTLCG